MYKKGDTFTVCRKVRKKRYSLLILACPAFVRKSHLHVNAGFLQCWNFLLFALEGTYIDDCKEYSDTK